VTQITSFNGFPKECSEFFNYLVTNNSRDWFNSHKSEYESYVLAPARSFVVAMGDRLSQIAPDIHAEPMIDRSIFRIHRDVRFSTDKNPYKTHLGIWLWQGEAPRMENSGFYFHLEQNTLMLGVGIYRFSQLTLQKYRQAVINQQMGEKLDSAIASIAHKRNYSIGGLYYKRVPRGYDRNHKRAELLRYNGLSAAQETKIPDEFYSDKLIEYCFVRYSDMLPIHQWLVDLTR